MHVDELIYNTKFIISDISGRKVKEYALTNEINYIEIRNTIIQPGVYIGIIINNSNKTISKQFIVIQ